MMRTKWVKFCLLCAAVAMLIFLIPKYLSLVEFLGYRISQDNVGPDYIKGFLWAVFLGLTIFLWPVRSQDKKALMWIWAVKCFVMLFLMLFYEYHYETDAFGYFHQAGLKLDSWKALFLEDQIRPNLPVTIISKLHYHSFLNSFHATKVTFGMIGFVAIYIFYRSVVLFLREEKILLLYIFAFFPSILFWSSILGKDPVVFFGAAVYCYGAVKFIRTGHLSCAIIMFLGITIGAVVRPWLGLIFGLPIFILIFKTPAMKTIANRIVVFFLVVTAILFSINKVMMTFGFKSFNELPRIASQRYVGFNRGGSSAKVELTAKTQTVSLPGNGGNTASINETEKRKYSSFKDLIIFFPRGIFTALFRPLPGEVRNAFGFLAGLEGVFLLILFVLAIKGLRLKKLFDPVVIWAILLVGVWASLYAFVSFNLGTVCRYRLQILPIFLGLLLYLAYDADKKDNLKNIRDGE